MQTCISLKKISKFPLIPNLETVGGGSKQDLLAFATLELFIPFLVFHFLWVLANEIIKMLIYIF